MKNLIQIIRAPYYIVVGLPLAIGITIFMIKEDAFGVITGDNEIFEKGKEKVSKFLNTHNVDFINIILIIIIILPVLTK